MKLDMSQLECYQREQEDNADQLRRLRSRQEFLRLQIKQTRQHAKAARSNKAIAAFVAGMPKGAAEVMPHPSGVYVAVTLSAMDAPTYRDVPERIDGIEFWTSERNSDALAAPTLHKYRSPGGVTYYVTEHVK